MTALRSPAAAPTTGVLLLNLGGPDSLEAVEPFLVNLFSDPFLIRLPLRGWLRTRVKPSPRPGCVHLSPLTA